MRMRIYFISDCLSAETDVKMTFLRLENFKTILYGEVFIVLKILNLYPIRRHHIIVKVKTLKKWSIKGSLHLDTIIWLKFELFKVFMQSIYFKVMI